MPQQYDWGGLPDITPSYDWGGLPDQQQQNTPQPTWTQSIIGTGISTLPAVGGAILGSFATGGPWGGVAGGMAGANLGADLRQQYDISQGLRKEYNPYVTGVETVLGGLGGFAKFPGVGAGTKALAKYAGLNALEGAAIGGAATPFQYAAETGQWNPSLENIATNTALGGVMGGTIGTAVPYGLGKIGHTAAAPSPMGDMSGARQLELPGGMLTPEPKQQWLPESAPVGPMHGPEIGPYGVESEYPLLKGFGRKATQSQTPYMPPVNPMGQGLMFGDMTPLPPTAIPPPTPPPTVPNALPTSPVTGQVPHVLTFGPDFPPDATNLRIAADKGYVAVPGMRSPEGRVQMVHKSVADLYRNVETRPKPVVPGALPEGQVFAENTVEIPPEKATESYIQNMIDGGYQVVGKSPLGKTIMKLVGSEEGSFSHTEMLENLRRLFGREPTPAEIEQGMARQPMAGEATGRVAPFEPRGLRASFSSDELLQYLNSPSITPELRTQIENELRTRGVAPNPENAPPLSRNLYEGWDWNTPPEPELDVDITPEQAAQYTEDLRAALTPEAFAQFERIRDRVATTPEVPDIGPEMDLAAQRMAPVPRRVLPGDVGVPLVEGQQELPIMQRMRPPSQQALLASMPEVEAPRPIVREGGVRAEPKTLDLDQHISDADDAVIGKAFGTDLWSVNELRAALDDPNFAAKLPYDSYQLRGETIIPAHKRAETVDVFDPRDGVPIKIFKTQAEADAFIANRPDLDSAPHDPKFSPKEPKQLPLKLRSEEFWEKRDIKTKQIQVEAFKKNAAELDPDEMYSYLSHQYADDELARIEKGPPGLTTNEEYGVVDITYRAPDGTPIAHAELYPPRPPDYPGGIGSFVGNRRKGLLYGRAVFAIAKKFNEYGVLKPSGGYSKHTANFINKIDKFFNDDTGSVPIDIEAFGKGWEKAKFFASKFIEDESGELRVDELWKRVTQATGWGQGGKAEITPELKKKEVSWVKNMIAFPSSAVTTGDLSPAGRQGLSMITTPQFWSAAKAMFKGGLSRESFDLIDAELRNNKIMRRPVNEETGEVGKSIGEKVGIKLFRPASEPGHHAENIASRWLETGGSIPYVSAAYRKTLGKPVRASNRAYITFLNHLNVNRTEFLFDRARDMAIKAIETGEAPRAGMLGGIQTGEIPFGVGSALKGMGLDARIGLSKKYNPAEAMDLNPYHNLVLGKEIADFVNTATGHAPLKIHYLPFKQTELSLEKAAGILNGTMFSPGLFFSRARMLNPSTYIMASPSVRKEYAKAMISTAGAWFAFTTLAKMAGGDEVDINYDVTSADFGKVRIGDTRMDPGGGFLQFLVMAGRMLNGGYTSSSTGEYHTFGEGFQAETQLSNALRFGSNKLNPVWKFAWDVGNQSQYQPFHVGDRSIQMFVPLFYQDMLELAYENHDLIPWLTAPMILGMGTQTYSKGESVGKFIAPENDWLASGGGVFDLIPDAFSGESGYGY